MAARARGRVIDGIHQVAMSHRRLVVLYTPLFGKLYVVKQVVGRLENVAPLS
jgi:hypothetical protein